MENIYATESLQTKDDMIPHILSSLYSLGVQHVNLCSCGAFTFEFENSNVSVSVQNAGRFFTQIPQSHFNTLYSKLVPSFCNCNHCVNHWGLDLCKCGSGEPFDACAGEFDVCGQPSQSLVDLI